MTTLAWRAARSAMVPAGSLLPFGLCTSSSLAEVMVSVVATGRADEPPEEWLPKMAEMTPEKEAAEPAVTRPLGSLASVELSKQ